MNWKLGFTAGAALVLSACGAASPPEAVQLPTREPAATGAEPAADALAQLEGLQFEDFLEASHSILVMRRPESLTHAGVAALYAMGNDQLNDLSDEYLRETQELEVEILERLREYEGDPLTPNQRVWYDTYEWYLENQVRGHQFLYHNYPVHHFVGSYQDELSRLFTELQPMETRQDALDYISRLSQVQRQIDQVIEGLEIRAELGIIPPSFILDMAIGQMYGYLGIHSSDPDSIDPTRMEVFTVFSDKLNGIPGLSASEMADFQNQALMAVETSYIPGYVALLETLEGQRSIATSDAGVWKFPSGDDFYQYALRTQTSTDLSPEEIHELGLMEVERVRAEMRGIFAQLGYPEDEPFEISMNRAMTEGGSFSLGTSADKDEVLAEYERLIQEAEEASEGVFDLKPTTEVIVVGDRGYSGGGYYVPGTLDGTRPGAFHTGIDGISVPKFGMPTLAYHEAVPGHHFQIGIAQEIQLPSFQKEVFFNGYVEGWALYAERLAAELGLYEDNPYGDLGRLRLELLRAARLVTDTGIHAKQWTRNQARAYLTDTLGGSRWAHEADRYIVLPGQANSYKIGMEKIIELRERAQTELGEAFDLKEFHRAVLENGSVPLEILENLIEEYIYKASG